MGSCHCVRGESEDIWFFHLCSRDSGQMDENGRVDKPPSVPHRTAVGPTTLPSTRRVDFTNPVARILPKGLPSNSCGNLIEAKTTVTWIYNRITLDINVATDAALRKTPILIARCPRGGKTTILELLHLQLKAMNLNAILASFSGTSGFQRLHGEAPCEALFRVITNELDANIPKQAPRVVDWHNLNAFLGSEPFVLMIDGLNTLCPIVETDLAAVLKEHFLDRKNRHLVITSYQPFLTEGRGDTTVSAGAAVAAGQLWGDRPLTIVPMPVCNDVARLRGMSTLYCSKITSSLAAFYGYMPSLMYAVCRQAEESPSAKFTRVVSGTSDNFEQLLDFVLTLITGIPHASLQRFYCFTSDVQIHNTLGVRVKWPLCYITCIFRHFAGQDLLDYIANSIDVLAKKCETVGDGMVWEQCIRVALLLRLFVASRRRNWAPPLDLCTAEEAYGADVRVLHLGQAVETTDDVRRTIEEHCSQFQKNTIVLYVPTEATLRQFDGYCVRFKDCAMCQMSGYQCEDNSKGANSPVPTWITKGGHLFRSNAPNMCKAGGSSTDGWIFYNAEDTDAFLGWSLRIMRV
eukprot:gene27240-32909_t